MVSDRLLSNRQVALVVGFALVLGGFGQLATRRPQLHALGEQSTVVFHAADFGIRALPTQYRVHSVGRHGTNAWVWIHYQDPKAIESFDFLLISTGITCSKKQLAGFDRMLFRAADPVSLDLRKSDTPPLLAASGSGMALVHTSSASHMFATVPIPLAASGRMHRLRPLALVTVQDIGVPARASTSQKLAVFFNVLRYIGAAKIPAARTSTLAGKR